MHNLVVIGIFLASLGVFFIGISALWWMSLQTKASNK
jgi:hypothetical protein